MIFVTHDQEEAMSIADRIAVLCKGDLIQIGTPLEIYQHPVNLWVAQFIGSYPINVVRGEYLSGSSKIQVNVGDIPAIQLDSKTRERWWKVQLPNQVQLGIRPEWVHLSSSEGEIPVTVTLREVLGERIVYHIKTPGNIDLHAVRPASEWFEVGQNIFASFNWERVFVFDPTTGLSLLISKDV
jgi:ABC-type sugar transport system ATPase subunit